MGLLKTLLPYFKPHRKLFILDLCCAVMVAVIDLTFPMASRYAMYTLLPDQKYRLFFLLMISFLLIYVLRSTFQYIMTYWGHMFGVRVETDMRAALFHHIQTLDFEFYDKNRTGRIMNRFTGDLFEITELSHHGPEDLLIAVLTIVGALFFMFRMQWKLALVVACMVPVFALVVILCRRQMSTTSIKSKSSLAGINAELEGGISGMRTSKAFANETYDYERFDRSNQEYQYAKKGSYKAMARFNSLQAYFTGAMPAVIIAVGGVLIMRDEMNYIDLITFTLFSNAFIQPINKLANFAEIFVNGMAGITRFKEIMEMEPSISDKPEAKELEITAGSVDITDVSFSYDGENETLSHIDLHIEPGEMIAVVGPSGGGKTTLCQLIPRFYEANSGSIALDKQDVRDVTLKSLRQQVGIVQQDVFIFAGTILENIRYGRPDATIEEVMEAARRAELAELIEEMPDGLDTYVGERGTKLSGGQKQRISIARIFLKNPKILILDEATSALDTITEAKIQKSFDSLSQGRTSVVIAHRLATVRNANRIVLIDHGKIVEQGTHDELLALDGGYAKLYNTQKLFAEE